MWRNKDCSNKKFANHSAGFHAIATAFIALDDAMIRGAIWERSLIKRIIDAGYLKYAKNVLFEYGQSTTFIMPGFAAGFTFGYITGSRIRITFDALDGQNTNNQN